jgi:hypothetical protein
MAPKLTAEQAQWQAESDARTLSEFFKIKKNKKRLKAARAVLKKEIAEKEVAIQKS